MRARLSSFTVGCLMICVCFWTVAWIQSEREDHGSEITLPDLLSLNQRLLVAKELGDHVSKDLHMVLEQIKNFSQAANHTVTNTAGPTVTLEQMQEDILDKPNLFLYLPHLREHPHSLLPNRVLSQGRTGVSVVLGIPTVKRVKQSYVVATLGSLLLHLTSSQCQDLLLIVFVAEVVWTFYSAASNYVM
ncbi:unnamed protein product [Knipowitschia caucasica]